VRTACGTEAEFIASFQGDCEDGSVFAPTDKMLASGTDCAFSLELADGQPMLRGLGVVVNSWPNANNRFGRAGVHIAFMQLTTASELILDRLLEARAVADRRDRARSPRISASMTPSFPDEDSVVREVKRSITLELQAVSPAKLSAPPVTPIDDQFQHTLRHEPPLRPPARPSRPPPVLAAEPMQEPPPAARQPNSARARSIPPTAKMSKAKPSGAGSRSSAIVARIWAMLVAAWSTVAARIATVPARFPAVAARVRTVATRLAPAKAAIAGRLGSIHAWMTARAATRPWWPTPRVAAVFAAGILLGFVSRSWFVPSRAPQSAAAPVAPVVVAAATNCQDVRSETSPRGPTTPSFSTTTGTPPSRQRPPKLGKLGSTTATAKPVALQPQTGAKAKPPAATKATKSTPVAQRKKRVCTGLDCI
jgi:hypothetical protein